MAGRESPRARGQGARLGRERRARSLQASVRRREEGGGEAGGRAPGAGGETEGRARRPGQGRARLLAPNVVAVVPGRRRARHGGKSLAHPEGGRTERTAGEADPGNQPVASDGAAPERGKGALRRLGKSALRPRR